MAQVLRITHKDKEYNFEVVNSEPLCRETQELLVAVNGTTYTLIRQEMQWYFNEHRDTFGADIAEAVGKAIALRYCI